jgi:predicted Zn-dependent peptidase
VNHSSSENSEVKFALSYLKANPIWDDITNQEKIDNAFRKAILGRYKSILTNLVKVRKYLKENTQVSVYNWSGNSEVARLIEELAERKYRQEPYEHLIRRIDSMDAYKLKDYLKRLVKDNMRVGIEILEDGKEIGI